MSKNIIEKKVEINAPASRVWEVLVNPEWLKQWAASFSEGTYAESDWEEGSQVLWKDKAGNIGAKGIVIENVPLKSLAVAFYDDVHADKQSATGSYTEKYLLSQADGKTTLNITAGPLPEEHYKQHEPLWAQAIEKIRWLGEDAMMVTGMDA